MPGLQPSSEQRMLLTKACWTQIDIHRHVSAIKFTTHILSQHAECTCLTSGKGKHHVSTKVTTNLNTYIVKPRGMTFLSETKKSASRRLCRLAHRALFKKHRMQESSAGNRSSKNDQTGDFFAHITERARKRRSHVRPTVRKSKKQLRTISERGRSMRV